MHTHTHTHTHNKINFWLTVTKVGPLSMLQDEGSLHEPGALLA
jgi:hypothetical protein